MDSLYVLYTESIKTGHLQVTCALVRVLSLMEQGSPSCLMGLAPYARPFLSCS